MWRAIIIFVLIAVAAVVAAWFADNDGAVTISWLGYQIQTSVMFALLAVALMIAVFMFSWSVVRRVIGMPGSVASFFRAKRRERGYEALSQGMIALGAGDGSSAAKYASQAERHMGQEPLTLLLKAQAAQASGDNRTANRVFRAMLQSRETETLGLRGLFVQARRDGDTEAARRYAERALRLKPDLPWAAKAMLTIEAAQGNWTAAQRVLDTSRHHKLIDRNEATRKKAVLLTAQALETEDRDTDAALALALDAHKLAPDLVPAAVVAGRILAAQSNTRKAARVLEKTWKRSPHPDVAEVYGAARAGDSPRDRLKRVKTLAQKMPHSVEGPIAVARAAIEAREWDDARAALKPLLADSPQARVCVLMAEIAELAESDRGKVREWLARAVHAPRDPAWTADGYVAEDWAPISPVTGALDAFEWKVPVEGITFHGDARVIESAEDLEKPMAEMPAPLIPEPTAAMTAAGAGGVRDDETPEGPKGAEKETSVKPAPQQPATQQPATAVGAGEPAAAGRGNEDEEGVLQPPPAAFAPAPMAGPKSSEGGDAQADAALAARAGDATTPGRSAPTDADKRIGDARPAPARPASPAPQVDGKAVPGAAEAAPPARQDEAKRAAKPRVEPAAAATPPPGRPPAAESSKPTPAVFVPPHAPDDPGPQPDDEAEGEKTWYKKLAAD